MPDYARHTIEAPALHVAGSGAGATIDFKESIRVEQAFTIEFWFKPDTSQGSMSVMSIYPEQSAAKAAEDAPTIHLWLVGGKPKFGYSTNLSTAQAVDFSLAANWCHITIVNNSANITVTFWQTQQQLGPFVLNALDGPQALGVTKIDLGVFDKLGSAVPSCKGTFSELRVWSKACTAAEITDRRSYRLACNEEGLVGYWMLDEGADNYIWDMSTNDNDGLIHEGDWDETRQTYIGDAEQQITHLENTKLPTLQGDYERKQTQRETLEAAVTELGEQKDEEDKKTADREESKVALVKKQEELANRRAAIASDKSETVARLGMTRRKIMLGDFIEQLQAHLIASRTKIGKDYANVRGLDSVAMKVKVVLAYGGIGLQLPEPGTVTEAGRLSTLVVRLRVRSQEEKLPARFASVPQLEGCTELFARREIAEAGFGVDVVYEAVETAELHGRVLRLSYEEIQLGQAALDNSLTLIVGQKP